MANSRSLFQNSVAAPGRAPPISCFRAKIAALCRDAATPERFSKKLKLRFFLMSPR